MAVVVNSGFDGVDLELQVASSLVVVTRYRPILPRSEVGDLGTEVAIASLTCRSQGAQADE